MVNIINNVITNFKANIDKSMEAVKGVGENLKKTFSSLDKGVFRFNMNTLTLLFTMMALQRITKNFLTSIITTFQKANEDTQGLGKSTWELQAAWEFFKYSLVDALTNSELFKATVEALVQIVQWFNKLSPTVKTLIVIALIFIFIAATIAFLVATFLPLIELIASLGVGTAGLGAIFWTLGIILAAVVLLWITDLGGFRDFFIQTLGILWATFASIFGDLWKIVQNVVNIIIAIFEGDWEKVGELIWDTIKRAVAIVMKLMIGLGAAIINIFAFIWNSVVDLTWNVLVGGLMYVGYKINEWAIQSKIAIMNAFSGAFDWVITQLNKLVKAWNSTVGALIGKKIDPFKFTAEKVQDLTAELDVLRNSYQAVKNTIQSTADVMKASYITSDQVKEKLAGVNDTLGIQNATISESKTGTTTTKPNTIITNSPQNTFVLQGSPEENYRYIKERLEDDLNRSLDSVNT